MKAEPAELWLAFGGGLIISLATSLHLLLKGRITGMSGLLGGIITPEGRRWKISFLAGMAIISCIFWLIFKFDPINKKKTYIFSPPATVISGLSLFGFALAGLLVGTGTRLANGCTSGHGVCGLPRLSVRSYVAVALFTLVGIGLATLRSNVHFLDSVDGLKATTSINYNIAVPIILSLLILAFGGYVLYLYKKDKPIDPTEIPIGFGIGVLFAIGLIVSGMIKREKVLGFLALNKNWDPSLGIVLLAAVIPNFITFHFIRKQDRPILGLTFDEPKTKTVDPSLIGGSLLFGLGWGLGGICPGPAYVLAPIVTPHISGVFILALITGYYALNKVLTKNSSVHIPFTDESKPDS